MKPESRLAVCSWSLQPAHPQELADRVLETGIRRVQIALDPLREQPAVWGEAAAVLHRNGIRIISGMVGCVGEDYTTLDTIRATGGIAPDHTWEENQRNFRAAAVRAADLGLRLVTFHAGFLPHDSADPAFRKMLDRLRVVAEIFGERKLELGLETGQETAAALADLLCVLDRPNVGVNFDPANMLLYDKGDPISAVRQLTPWLRQVHIKDARRTKIPGTWGEEVAVGTGEVDWPAFFKVLAMSEFQGDCVIEREAGTRRVADICAARQVVEKTFSMI